MNDILALPDWIEIRKRLSARRRWRRIRTFSLIVGMGVILGLAFARMGAG